jgi:hypothetical protein
MGISISTEKIVGKRPLEEIRDALLQMDREALGGGLDRVQVGCMFCVVSPQRKCTQL